MQKQIKKMNKNKKEDLETKINKMEEKMAQRKLKI